MTEQQQHFSNLLEQQKTIIQEIQELEKTILIKRELALKLQGALEYLQQIGVTAEAPPTEQPQVEEKIEE